MAVAERVREVDEAPQERLNRSAGTPATSRTRPTSKPTTPRRFRVWASRSSGERTGADDFSRKSLSRKRRPSTIALPMSWPMVGLGSAACGVTRFRQSSGGTGRAMTRRRTSASRCADARPAASRLSARASGLSTSRSGHDADAASRATAEADAGRTTGLAMSTAAPGHSDRSAFSTRVATCRLATTSQRSSPSTWTTWSSIDGQPTRQPSKPRRCRGWKARTSSAARSGSGTSPAGAEMTSRTASALEASS